jgi:RNA polymerase sigma factor (sigma-70 family)
VAYRLCGSAHEADDPVQSAITALYVGWRRIHTVGNLDAYVRAMVVRAYLSERRRPWHRVGRSEQPPERVAADRAGVEDRLVLRAALDRLPRRQRTVVVLRFLYDMSVARWRPR